MAEVQEENNIRDPKDLPPLKAVLDAHTACLLTGDPDFPESSIPGPRLISVPQFPEDKVN